MCLVETKFYYNVMYTSVVIHNYINTCVNILLSGIVTEKSCTRSNKNTKKQKKKILSIYLYKIKSSTYLLLWSKHTFYVHVRRDDACTYIDSLYTHCLCHCTLVFLLVAIYIFSCICACVFK